MNLFRALLIPITLLFSSFAYAEVKTTFVFAEINEAIMPIDRGTKYEDPLDDFLKKENLGEVTGGGTLQDKNGKILSVGLDIELSNLKKGIPILKKKLIELGAPKNSTLQYEDNGKKIKTRIDG